MRLLQQRLCLLHAACVCLGALTRARDREAGLCVRGGMGGGAGCGSNARACTARARAARTGGMSHSCEHAAAVRSPPSAPRWPAAPPAAHATNTPCSGCAIRTRAANPVANVPLPTRPCTTPRARSGHASRARCGTATPRAYAWSATSRRTPTGPRSCGAPKAAPPSPCPGGCHPRPCWSCATARAAAPSAGAPARRGSGWDLQGARRRRRSGQCVCFGGGRGAVALPPRT